ncbi:MAG: OmpA family protein [Cytophagia bacterium]|nr:MAG: OmpA family protein [Runella sp.]TAG22200.1 MAG: OmpA family protein [Cytophagales bacterium]TAG41289.1 MAG: OmpA family protein [Cytophagia bacterium]TAG52869.1 MAG: OmpA family protein [Runella slithyformis]TAG70928.1 MAG: OmpA family protein [Runella slithyformis]
MKTQLLIAVLSVAWWVVTPTFGQKITTMRPYVQEQTRDYVEITKIELTNDYTIIYFSYENTRQRPSLFDLFGNGDGGSGATNENIQIDPKSRLYEPQNVNKKFRFIKAEGIAISPENQRVYVGDRVKFVVYFERLTPGIEVFDMYEGKDYKGFQFWNFYGIHIKNPKPKTKPQPTKPKPEPPIAADAPLPVPSTTVSTLATVRGTVLNAKTKQPVAAKINCVVPNDDNGFDSLQLSASSGKFKLSLAPNQRYNYAVSAKGYLPASGVFDLSKTAGGQESNVEILLTPVAVGEAITLNNVYFDVAKFELLPTSYAELDRLVSFMQDSPKVEVRVEGHTDNLGDFDENVKLSLNRADAVKQYLVGKGIAVGRVQTKGYGPTRPVSKGTSETERRRNRRVELAILKL